jgi:hypothetical protein
MRSLFAFAGPPQTCSMLVPFGPVERLGLLQRLLAGQDLQPQAVG